MLHFFRSFFSSKVGIAVTLAFVALIALSFAGSGISGGGGFGAFSSGNKVATVGSEGITAPELDSEVRRYLEQQRQQNPQLTIKDLLAEDGLNRVLSFLINSKATVLWGQDHGLYIGDRLIDHETAKDSRMQGPDGKVDPDLYKQALAQQGLTDAQYRAEQVQRLMARQLLGSTTIGLKVPVKMTRRYVGVVAEHRKGYIITLPPAAFAPTAAPSDAEITAWYNGHKGQYILPERRTVRYAAYTDAAVKDVAAPTDAEVAARYIANKAKYAPTDKRKLSQMVLPTQAAAAQVLAATSGGATLEAAAKAKGLAVAPLGSLTKDAYALQGGAEAAAAVFAAPNGKIVGPFKSPLGWVVVRVDARETTAGKSAEQARPELVKELTEEKRRTAITEFSARIEDELGNGASLTDVAKELGLEVLETPALTGNGAVYGAAGQTAPPLLARVVPSVFQMDGPGSPQLAEVDPGKSFVIFDIGKLTPAAPPPLAEIRAQVSEDARIDKGEKAAKAAAEKVKADIERGVPAEVAVASLGVALPPLDRVDMDRQQVRAKGQAATRPLLLLFSMAKGKVILMQGPRNHGWYVVTVTEVTPGKVSDQGEAIDGVGKSLVDAQREEYGEQLSNAFRSEVGSTRNDGNVSKLQGQLSGKN